MHASFDYQQKGKNYKNVSTTFLFLRNFQIYVIIGTIYKAGVKYENSMNELYSCTKLHTNV